jgi:hypothetical protein
MGLRVQAGVALAALMSSAAALAQTTAEEAQARWGEIAKCAAVADPEARLACTDAVMRRAGLLDDEQVARQARREFGNEARAQIPRPAPQAAPSLSPALSPAPSPASPPVPTRGRDIEELATTVTAARMRGNRLLVTTAEGSTWEQSQSETFRTLPKPGEAFSIERTALGGFRCSFERSTVYRCRRVD